MIFTNCGNLGDAFLCLPILSWYSKNVKDKVVFALADHFAYSRDAEELLKMQECIDDVIYFHYDDTKCESRHADNLGKYHVPKYMFDDTKWGTGDVISLGFHKWPDKYIPELYAEEYGLSVDYDFKLNYGEPDCSCKDWVVKVDKFDDPKLQHIEAVSLTPENGMVKNLQYAAGAAKAVTFTTGFSVMATLARIPIELWSYRHLISHHNNYFHIAGDIDWRYLDDAR